jgi:hypothetical protein
LAVVLLSGCQYERVGQPERVVLSAQHGGAFGNLGGERNDVDAHAGDRSARVGDPVSTRERDERLGVRAGGCEQLSLSPVGLLDLVDRSVVVAVGAVEPTRR